MVHDWDFESPLCVTDRKVRCRRCVKTADVRVSGGRYVLAYSNLPACEPAEPKAG